MVDIQSAIKIAKRYYADKYKTTPENIRLSKIYEAEKVWIAYLLSEKVQYGNTGISIDKDTGKVERFILHSSPKNFAILKSAKLTVLQ